MCLCPLLVLEYFIDNLTEELVNKYQKIFWDNVNNKDIVNKNLLANNDVVVADIEGHKVLLFYIPKATRELYLNGVEDITTFDINLLTYYFHELKKAYIIKNNYTKTSCPSNQVGRIACPNNSSYFKFCCDAKYQFTIQECKKYGLRYSTTSCAGLYECY